MPEMEFGKKNVNLTRTKLLMSTVKRMNHSKYLCSTSILVRQRNISHLLQLTFLHTAQLVRGETQHSGKQSLTSITCTDALPCMLGLDTRDPMFTAQKNTL